jgi:hypothetical protein
LQKSFGIDDPQKRSEKINAKMGRPDIWGRIFAQISGPQNLAKSFFEAKCARLWNWPDILAG